MKLKKVLKKENKVKKSANKIPQKSTRKSNEPKKVKLNEQPTISDTPPGNFQMLSWLNKLNLRGLFLTEQ